METETAPQQQEQRPQTPVSQEMLDKALKTLTTMLDYLGLEASVKVEGRSTKINLLVSSDDAGRIIGRKGQSLESLQLLVNRMAQKANQDFPKVYIDIDGYSSKRGDRPRRRRREDEGPSEGRSPEASAEGSSESEGDSERSYDRSERSDRGERDDRRRRDDRGGDRGERDDRRRHHSRDEEPSEGDAEKDEILSQQALDAAKEVKRWGEPVTLPPMNSHDRRIIHVTLQDDTEISTESLGDGNLKSVIIAVKKKD